MKFLLDWYKKNARDLPWRNTRDPYEIWVSEVILQQTRVDQGLPYYYNFITQFPDILSLANAEEDEVLRVWQGLGYYSRARNMKKAAEMIRDHFQSVMPDHYEALIQVPGIGPYTAAAVSSFAFGEARPAIDGNVRRVASRWFGLEIPVGTPASDREILRRLTAEMAHCDPATFNQAMMELGATVCTPRKPACSGCPLQQVCVARLTGQQEALPVVAAKKAPETMYLDYLFLESEGRTWLYKRDKPGIWKGLYEFPAQAGAPQQPHHPFPHLFTAPEQVLLTGLHTFKHKLTHRTIFARLWHLSASPSIIVEQKDFLMIRLSELHNYPVHRLMSRMMKTLELI